MQMIKKAKKLEEMFAVFDPFPLVEKEQFDEFYVDTYEARGANVVKLMSYGLEYSLNPYMKILFMGHRGSGKSTELSLLMEELKGQFEIINFFIQNEIDTDNMTYIDFIFAIMSQIIKYIETNTKLSLSNSDIEGLYNYWYGEKVIEESEFDYGEMAVDFSAKLSFLKQIILSGGGILKTGSESKTSLRRKIEPKVGYLVMLMNQIIQKINKQLESNGSKGLLMIIEDLDKISIDTAEGLFIKHRKTWLSLNVRLILTFPIFMAYNAQYSMIKEDVDMFCMLSMIKVTNRDKSSNEQGIDKLLEIIGKRSELSLFENGALMFLINKSGGALRDLFQMIRDASFDSLLNGSEKITMKSAQNAYNKLKSENERLIRSEKDVEKLIEIYNEPQLLITDDTVMELLLKGLVLEYNGERWCGIHPTVEDFLREKGKINGRE